MSGKSLRVFVTGDSPRSLKKVTEFNWSGYAFYGTREQIRQLAKRNESDSTGVYFLLSDINTEMVRMYVGETNNFLSRLKIHHQKKDWWTHFIVFQSNGNSLNKAHVQYLEHLFWEKANESTQIEVMNDQVIKQPSLSEEDVADLAIFEENILFILEAMNLGYFNSHKEASSSTDTVEYTSNVPYSEYSAQMLRIDDTYVLKAGSHLRTKARASFEKRNSGYFKKWQEIINSSNVEHIDNEVCRLNKDLEFSSPSAAGVMVKAGATNGLTQWRNTQTGKTIKEELGDIEEENE
ncbi:GIY-YIG nuclease family protein [Halobacteriovorax sp. RZ-3]|uniref:GIY-YIG nuclease family protein n=1 Tax=Halobacteriovorax sp. RZ-3 TaxID=3157720 RepID=UPI0037149E10